MHNIPTEVWNVLCSRCNFFHICYSLSIHFVSGMRCSDNLFNRYRIWHFSVVAVSSQRNRFERSCPTQPDDWLLPVLFDSTNKHVSCIVLFEPWFFRFIKLSRYRLLKYAEEHHLPKRLNSEYGGGLKEFVRSEENKFEGFENLNDFFSMQERQWLILKLLETLRTRSCEEIRDAKFIEGQAISTHDIFHFGH